MTPRAPGDGLAVWTVGHSTRSFDELLALLRASRIGLLADVRTVPRSRRHPHWSREAMVVSLPAHGIDYVHLPGLGGLRKPRRDSVNTGWRNASFQGYADYMQTDGFVKSLGDLVALAARSRVAVMCAEAVPWRCHRSLIADALVVRDVDVRHIIGPGEPKPHVLTAWAKRDGVRLTYPPEQGELGLGERKAPGAA